MLDFEEILRENPADWDCRLAFADWCEEHGREAYGRALRYLATNNRHPVLLRESSSLSRPWLFGGPDNGGENPHWAPCKLNWDVHCLLLKAVGRDFPVGGVNNEMWFDIRRGRCPPFSFLGWVAFTTQQQATEYLGRALERVGCRSPEGV
jgi:uncharacterized protein (TIGR02996 family)